MDYRIEDDGDAIERRWGKAVGHAFSNYESFWVKNVIPITWRVAEGSCLYVRSGVPGVLKTLATYSYGIFIHLAAAHEQLEIAERSNTDAELFARTGIYTFYNRVYSAGALVPKFLEVVKDVVDKYKGTHLKTVNKRLGAHCSGDLYDRYDVAFKQRTKDYRSNCLTQ
jgi:hypothetical protein